MIFVDSNILIDIIELDPQWSDWSQEQLAAASGTGPVVISPIVVAEVAPYSGELDDFLEKIEIMGVQIEPLCSNSAFAAGAAFKSYRLQRGQSGPKSILSDFLIGGHAQYLDATILTRDARFYRTYFPSVPLITPLKDEND